MGSNDAEKLQRTMFGVGALWILCRPITISHRMSREFTYSSPLPLRARLRDAICLLQTSTTRASRGSPTGSKRVTELIRELTARLMNLFTALEHAAAVLPCLGWGGHCVFGALDQCIVLYDDIGDKS